MLKKASTHVLGSIYLHALAHPRRLHLICSSLASCRNMLVAESTLCLSSCAAAMAAAWRAWRSRLPRCARGDKAVRPRTLIVLTK
jgi:hypothetical protein